MDEGVNEGGTNTKVFQQQFRKRNLLVERSVLSFKHEFSDTHKRKFDQDLDNELRILEEFFISRSESRFI